MTREEIYNACLEQINKNPCLIIEAATGLGKTKIAIDLINHLVETRYKGEPTKMLLLVAKTVHKQTWKDEFEKWGGIKVDEVVIECYESLKKHVGETFTFVCLDECHHLGSETRLELIQMVKAKYMLGLSATIPKGVKMFFRWKYKAVVVSCDLTEAIEDEILPEPTILLMPLSLETTRQSEEIIINPKVKSPVETGEYKDRWKYKKQKNIKAILKCTQQQKLEYLNSQITWMKDQYMRTRSKIREQSWLYLCGKRLEFLADCKLNMVKAILSKLKDYRTITFCKTISQTEELGANCIHSKNKKATEIYDAFNNKKIKHITAVNILNENANLVDCKYAIFANLSSSAIITPQRLGRALRHKKPVIIIPYYKGTREQEIVDKLIAGFKPEFIKTIKSITEI